MSDIRADTSALLEALREAALIVAGGQVVVANSAAKALLGDSIESAAIADVISHPAALEALRRPGQETDGVDLTGLDGSRRHWLMHSSELANGMRLIRFVDRSEARAAEQMRVDFVANASHELRTPLATLIGYTETLLEGADDIDPPTRSRFLSVVHDEARRMQRVVEDLISLSRIEAEKFTAPTEAVALDSLIEQAIASARRMAEERRSQLVTDVAANLPEVAGDSGQILQLLDNLITNALRYGEAGTPVTVAAGVEGSMVRLSISDEGEGIPASHLPRVTERFYRVDTSRSRSLGGTGLGLSIVKHIVERHRGRLTIDSKVGQGTTVHVLLPVADRLS